jgi:hypothetical protein
VKALFTIVLLVGGAVLYSIETSKPMIHASLAHRAVPGVVLLVVLAVIAAFAKSREQQRTARSDRASRYSRGSSRYPY